MRTPDGLNYECPSCHNTKYRQNDKLEAFVINNRQSRTCDVCGKVMVPNNGGFSCWACSSYHYELNNKHKIELLPRRSDFPPNYIRLSFIVFISFIMISLAARSAVAESVEAIDVEFNFDPIFGGTASPINIANATESDTVINEWIADLDSDMPNGTYYGCLWSPSLFEHNFKPTWIKNDSLGIEGQFTYVLIASHFNFSTQVLMSGTSEWWVRVPINPDCIEPIMALQFDIFKNVDNASDIGFQSLYYTRNVIPRPSYNGYMPDQLCYFQFDGDDFSAGAGRVTNNHLYLQINAVIRPDTDYVFALCFRMKEDSSLRSYWSTNELPAGGWTAIHVAEFLQSDNGTDTKVQVLDASSIEVAMDLDWSFIFVEGIGKGGLFGKKMYFQPTSTLNIYPFMNTSRSGNQYISVMWPFISDESVNASVAIYNSLGGSPGLGYHMWKFADGAHYFQPSYCYTYHDFILFSTNSTLNWTHFVNDDRWNIWVEYTFNNYTNLTMLCYEDNRPNTLWSALGSESTNSSINPFLRPYWTPPNDAHSYDWQAFYYEIWTSCRGTDGQWAYQIGTPSGAITYTYHFPQEIHISSQYYELIRISENDGDNQTNELALYEQYWRTATEKWNGHEYVEAAYYAMKAAISFLWDGAGSLVGQIRDFASQTWEQMKSIGSWIVAKVKEFIGQIWDFIQEAWDTIAHFWDSAKYLFAPLIMMAIVGIGARFTKTALSSSEGSG